MSGAIITGRPGVVRRLITSALGLGLLIWLFACGGGSSPAPQSAAPPLSTPDIALRVAAEPAAGDTLRVAISVSDAAELYQLSCRLGYDARAVEPLTVERGALVDGRAAFFSTTAADGYVPVAFTYHPGEEIPAPMGSIAVLEFRVVDAAADPRFRVIGDAEFLIARDSAGRALNASLGVGQ